MEKAVAGSRRAMEMGVKRFHEEGGNGRGYCPSWPVGGLRRQRHVGAAQRLKPFSKALRLQAGEGSFHHA